MDVASMTVCCTGTRQALRSSVMIDVIIFIAVAFVRGKGPNKKYLGR